MHPLIKFGHTKMDSANKRHTFCWILNRAKSVLPAFYGAVRGPKGVDTLNNNVSQGDREENPSLNNLNKNKDNISEIDQFINLEIESILFSRLGSVKAII